MASSVCDFSFVLEGFREKYEKGDTSKEEEKNFLAALADDYMRREHVWTNLLKAHSLYNSCFEIFGDDVFLEKAYYVQEKFWQSRNLETNMSLERSLWLNMFLKERLAAIRDLVSKLLLLVQPLFSKFECDLSKLKLDYDQTIESQFSQATRVIAEKCNWLMVDFFGLVINRALELCGPAPCAFTVVGLGSLAKGECTPYSDFEYLFLLENGVQSKEYFENLAITSYFLIGNLGETKLKTMDVLEIQDWYHDRTRPGCKIDGLQKHAGNIPTGNGYQGQHNKFICTVDELLAQFQNVLNNPDEKETTMADLSAMLASTVFVYGSQNLLILFESSRSALAPNAERKKYTIDLLIHDILHYRFQPGEGYDELHYAKTDLFRYPSLLVHGLKVYYSLVSSKSHELVDELSVKELISPSLKLSLLFLLSTSQFVRLSSYIHHGSQKDDISFLYQSQQTETGDGVKGPWVIPSEIMLHMSIHLLTVKTLVGSLRNGLTILLEPLKYNLLPALAIVYYYTNHFSGFLSLIEEMDWDSTHEVDQMRLKWMQVKVLFTTGKFHEAKQKTEEFFSTHPIHMIANDDMGNSFKAFLNSGKGAYALLEGNPSGAAEHYQSVVELYKSIHKKHPNLAGAYCDLGSALSQLGKCDEAGVAYLSALQMYKHLYGPNSIHERIASVHNLLGNNYFFLKKYAEAERHFLASVEMYLKLDHLNLNKPIILFIFISLANVKFQQGKHEEFQVYMQKAKNMNII